jgi:hypothetical protein
MQRAHDSRPWSLEGIIAAWIFIFAGIMELNLDRLRIADLKSRLDSLRGYL